MTWIEYDTDSRREAFRYTSLDGQPIFMMEFSGKSVSVLDISAGGLSFNGAGFKVGQIDRVILPIQPVLALDLKVVQIDENDVCHALFESITEAEGDILHRFVLERQKQDLRNGKIRE